MGEIRVRVQRLRKRESGYYWQPTPTVVALGFSPEALGKELYPAIRRAEALNKSVADAKAGIKPGANVENVRELIKRYRASERYVNLRASTKPVYDVVLNKIEAAAGAVLVSKIDRRGLVETHNQIKAAKGIKRANAHMKIWRVLLDCAMNIGWRHDNPAEGYGGADYTARKRVWTAREIDGFCARAEALGRASLALAVRLAHNSSQRQGDILRLRWSDYDGIAITLCQSKTGKWLRVPLSPSMRDRLRDVAKTAVQIVVNEKTGRPYNEITFRHAFRAVREAARLPTDLQFRDLRRTAATELGQAGATDDEIRAVTGHQSKIVAGEYVLPDDRMAKAGQEKRTARQQKVGK